MQQDEKALKVGYRSCTEAAALYYIREDLGLDPELQDIYKFREKMNLPARLRGDLPELGAEELLPLTQQARRMFEECNEFLGGLTHNDLAEMADALVDLVYFAKGTAAMLGLPWELLWNAVQTANMQKVPGVSKRGDATNDVKKLEGWMPPDVREILGIFQATEKEA